MMLHPGRVVEHQSASSCCAGRCVVVRRTRSVDYAAVTFCTVLTFVKFHAEIFSNFSHSLSTAAYAAGIFIA